MKKGRLVNILKMSLAMAGMLGTMVLSNIQVVKAEKIIHTHIWATKYDNNKHWEYCTVCKEVKDEKEHKFTDHWREAKESCWHENYSTRVCECGYSYIYHKPHGERSGWKNDVARLLHCDYCKDCGTWFASERCKDVEGIINCKNPGKCNVCGAVTTADNHYLNKTGNCRDCGMKLVDITAPEIKYSSDYTKAIVTFKITPKAEGLTLTGKMTSYVPTKNYKKYTWTSIKNNDGSYTYQLEHIFDERIQRKCEYRCADSEFVLSMNGTPIYMDQETVRFTVSQDHTAPTIAEINQKDQAFHNGWATIKELTITGKEDLSDLVNISIVDKQTGDVIVNKATADVVDRNYMYKCTPALEGPVEGRTYQVLVVDQLNHTTKKDFTIYKTDCRAPLIRSGKEYTEWSKTKNIALELTDYGAGTPETSLNNQVSYKKATKDGDKYKALYTFAEDKYDVTEYTLYLRDGLGNATKDTFKVGKIDNTKPTITEVKSSVKSNQQGTDASATNFVESTNNDNQASETASNTVEQTNTVGSTSEKTKSVEITIKANDKNKKLQAEGSGVAGYAVTKELIEPKAEEWKKDNTFTVNKSGKYYLWVKDAVGNIADISVVNVKDDFSIIITEEKIEYKGGNNTEEVQNIGKDKNSNDKFTDDKKGEDDATPKTGDVAPLVLVAVILFISGVVMVLVNIRKKKRII